MDQQLFLRDDIIQFSSKLNLTAHNVKTYRKSKGTFHNKKIQNLLASTDQIHKLPVQSQRTSNQDISTKRLSSTAAVRRRSQLTDLNRTDFFQVKRNTSQEASQIRFNSARPQGQRVKIQNKKQEKSQKIEQSKNKTKSPSIIQKIGDKSILQAKHMESWLNQIILQYCSQQKFDLSLENPALKKYGMDRNSLLSKGVSVNHVERIYQSLFVYSMGFNTLLGQLAGGSSVRKSLWRVFAILLQYCSEGHFQTMIGEMQRDKLRKVQQMRQEIEKRQKLLQNNQEIHQEKNAKIFKQLKILRQQKINLQNDKAVLMEDFKQAQQAFNQEVSLRLKFQNKINQIHGVHRELVIKHQRLYDDLQLKNSMYSEIKQKYQKKTDILITMKNQNQFLKQQILALNNNKKQLSQLVQSLKLGVAGGQLKEIQQRRQRQQLASIVQQKQRKVEQMRNQVKNAQLMVNLKDKSQKQLQKQYIRALQQNKRLVTSLQQRTQQINNLLLQKKQSSDLNSHVHVQLDLVKQKLTVREKQMLVMRQKQKQYTDEIMLGKQSILLVERKVQMLQKDLKDCYVKIQQMKKIKSRMQDELVDLQAKEAIFIKSFEQKDNVIINLNEQIQSLTNRISDLNIAKKISQSKVQILTNKLQSSEEVNKKKIQKLQQELEIIQKKYKQNKQQLEIRKMELEKNSINLQDINRKLKDVLFEKNDLELKYNQSLTVVQSQTDHIKTLNIKISQNNQRIQQQTRKLRTLQASIITKQKIYNDQIEVLNKTINNLKRQIQLKKIYIHPLVVEDLIGNLDRSLTKNNTLMNIIKNDKKQAEIISLRDKIIDLQKKIGKKQQKHREQIQRFEQRILSLQQRINKQQSRESTPSLQKQSSHRDFKQKQKKYIQILKQKSQRIDSLVKQIQIMHDSNRNLIVRLKIAEENILKQKQKILEISKIKQNQNISKDNQATNNFQIQKQRIKSKQIQIQQSQANNIELESKLNIPSSNSLQQEQSKSNRKNNSREGTRAGWRNDFSKKVKNAYNYYNK